MARGARGHRGKNDAADAAAICEAVTRPSMRFVPIKSTEQQGALMLHRARDLLVCQRTQLLNAVRSHLAELGLVAAQGRDGMKGLIALVPDDGNAVLSGTMREALGALVTELSALQQQIDVLEQRIHVHHRANDWRADRP